VAGNSGDGTDAISLVEYVTRQFDQSVSWRDLEWLRSVWAGPIVLKGIQTVADAQIAAREGIEAIALSNHGGRQLDSASAGAATS
jgi:L-lactate dehydrogenase (cytochrome)